MLRSFVLASGTCAAAASIASAALAIGDISIVGFNSNAPDNFTFATWVDLPAGTVIKFSDNGFLSTSASTASSNARGGENHAQWTAPAGGLTAGTVVRIQDGATPSVGTISGSLSGLSSSGDQIFVYEGTGTGTNYASTANPTTFSGTPLFILTFGAGFLSTGTASSNTSYLPSDLNVANGNIALSTASTTRGQFNLPRNNMTSFADYRTLVNTASNWTTATGAGTITLDTTAFVVPEPASLGLLGLASLVGLRRRSR